MLRTTIITHCADRSANFTESLNSLESHTDPGTCEWLLLVDGASELAVEGLSQAQSCRPWIRIIHIDRGTSLVSALNRGAREARTEALVFLHEQARVGPGWLSALTSASHRYPDAAIGAKLVDSHGCILHAGGCLLADGRLWNVGHGDDPEDPEYHYLREVDWCSEAALLVPRMEFLRVGGFDETAPPRVAGIDLARKLRNAGLRVIYGGHAEIVLPDLVGLFEGWQPGTGGSFGDVLPELSRKWGNDPSGIRVLPTTQAEARKQCDRRARYGKQVLMTAEELPQFDRNAGAWTFYRFMTLLIEAGHHVTFVARNTSWRWPDVDLKAYVRKYEEAGCLVRGLDNEKKVGRSLAHDAAFARILQRRRYDAALLWTARDGRWFLEIIQQVSPETRTVINSGDLQFIREGRGLALSSGYLGIAGSLSDVTSFGPGAGRESTVELCAQ
jgi:O-antigen biosynthesis protein